MPLKIALEEPEHSFLKLKIKVRPKILADGLNDASFDVRDVGEHLDALEFHELVGSSNVELIDMRNHYETEVGHFEGAFLPKTEAFGCLAYCRGAFEGKEDQKILLYCTVGFVVKRPARI